jgi:hypothetical protein
LTIKEALTSKWLRRTCWVASVVFLAAGILITLAFVQHRYKAQRARRLVSAVESLQLGESRLSDVQRVVTQYRSDLLPSETNCRSGSDCYFTFQIHTAFWWSLFGHGAWLDALANHFSYWTEYPVFARLGMRNFMVTASLRVTYGVVKGSSVAVIVQGDCRKWLGGSWRLLPVMPPFPKTRFPVTSPPNDHLDISWSHLHMGLETGESLNAVVTPDATPEEKAAAFGINMNCLTSRSGCFFLDDLMPGAVQFKKLRRPMGGTSQACLKHTDPD